MKRLQRQEEKEALVAMRIQMRYAEEMAKIGIHTFTGVDTREIMAIIAGREYVPTPQDDDDDDDLLIGN